MNRSQELAVQIAQLIQQHVSMPGQPRPQPFPPQLLQSIVSAFQQQSTAAASSLRRTDSSASSSLSRSSSNTPVTPVTPQNSAPQVYHHHQSLRRTDSSASSSSLRRTNSSASSSSLSRSSSNISSASTTFSRNVARRLIQDDEAGFDECFQIGGPRRRRRTDRTSPEMKSAVKIVTKPVLRQIDDPYLSKKKSSLFKHKFKKGGKKNRKLRKKNAEIVGPLFKVLVVPTLKILFIREYDAAKSKEPNLTPFEFRQRLFNAALKVVRKRRANHVQSWRLNNCPKPLIYSNASDRLPADLFDQKDNHDSDFDDGARDGHDSCDSENFEESQYQIPLSQPPVDFSEEDDLSEDGASAATTSTQPPPAPPTSTQPPPPPTSTPPPSTSTPPPPST